MNRVLDQLRRNVLSTNGMSALSDGQLLERYIAEGDESAFAALVGRHGPMIMGVCRRMLGNAADAEDAFQASFLVLVRRARTIVPRELVGNWLYGVAYHTARKARESAVLRREREHEAGLHHRHAATDGLGRLREVLDAGLRSLPERYRAAVVLCDLEGKSRKEVAGQLGWPEGTVASRLSRGRDLLARRLKGHGLMFSASALAALLAEGAALARVPAPLVTSTLKSAAAYAAGAVAAAGIVPGGVVALTEGVLKAMWMTKLKIAAVVMLTVGFAGAGVFGHLSMATGQVSSETKAAPGPGPNTAADRDQTIAALVLLLKDSDPEVRRRAVELLIALNKDPKAGKPGLRHDLESPAPRTKTADALKADEALKAAEKEKTAAELQYLRRAHLDATGTLPTPEETKNYLADPNPDRRAKLVDALLANKYFAQPGEADRLFFAPDGKVIAVVRGSLVELLDAATGKELRRFVVQARIGSVAFSPAGDNVVVATDDHKIQSYQLASGKLLWVRTGSKADSTATPRP
jgi:RNA polymerase sigma factor (sigma-70 family)